MIQASQPKTQNQFANTQTGTLMVQSSVLYVHCWCQHCCQPHGGGTSLGAEGPAGLDMVQLPLRASDLLGVRHKGSHEVGECCLWEEREGTHSQYNKIAAPPANPPLALCIESFSNISGWRVCVFRFLYLFNIPQTHEMRPRCIIFFPLPVCSH